MQYFLGQPQTQQALAMQNPAQQQSGMPPVPQQMPQQVPFDPITAGTLTGMQSARRSLEMDAQERKRAMGMGMLRFAQGLGQVGHGPGLAGSLSRINASLMPAVEQYNSEEDRVGRIKEALLKQQFELEKYQQERQDKMKRHAEEDILDRERISATRENGRLNKDAAKELMISQIEEKLRSEGTLPENALLKIRMTPGERQETLKLQNKIVKAGEYASKSVEAIKSMEDVFINNPDLWNGIPLLIYESGEKNKSVINQFMRGLTEEKQKAFQILKKELNTVVDLKIEQGGGRQTDVRKKIILEMMPSGEMHPEVALGVLKQMRNRDLYDTYKSEETKKAIAGQYDIQYPSYDEFLAQQGNKPKGPPLIPKKPAAEAGSNFSALSEDELNARIKAKQEAMAVTD